MADNQASNYLELALLNHVVRAAGGAAFSQPNSSILQLCKSTMDDTISTVGSAPTMDYTGYTSASLSAKMGNVTLSTDNITAFVTNTAAVNFGENTGGTTQTAQSFVLAASTGNSKVLLWGPLGANLTVTPGVTPEFGVGDFVIECK